MNPVFFDDSPATRSRWEIGRQIAIAARAAGRALFFLLTYDPLVHIVGLRVERGSNLSKLARGIAYRVAFVPLGIALTCCAIVWSATHPPTTFTERDPGDDGLYFDAVSLTGAGGVRLEGWLVPQLDAKTVLADKDQVLRKRRPAVLLLHDSGQRMSQMLPLIRPLHDAGYTVLAMNLRGGLARPAAGQTFGLIEAGDVTAATDLLSRRPFVDPKRIGAIGIGTGATAALLAARSDSRLIAVAALGVPSDGQSAALDAISPHAPVMKYLTPMCKWTFEIAYGVDLDDAAPASLQALLASGRALRTDASLVTNTKQSTAELLAFLHQRFGD